ncbi:MAG TPA: DUF6335 family protein [Anaerolineales bacterium]|nr:DUF6335 family protein [Anaerolineales bacterium]
MAEENEKRLKNEDEEEKVLPHDGREGPVDPYTGEVEPPAPDAYKISEIVPTDPDNREGENYLMEEEDSLDKFVLDANTDEILEQLDDYTDDQEVLEDFAERQGLASGGRQKLEEKLNEHNSLDPSLSGGDVDAAWEDTNVAGEESVGGSVSTPDQDVVDELGEAAGLTYRDDEALDYDRKVLNRDRDRWELNPASADDEEEEDTDEEQQ